MSIRNFFTFFGEVIVCMSPWTGNIGIPRCGSFGFNSIMISIPRIYFNFDFENLFEKNQN